MDFEPRESRLETFGKRALTVGAILLCALVLYWRSPLHSRLRSPFNLRTVSLPQRFTTLAEAYPSAVKLKDRASPKSELEVATAFVRQKGGRFETEMFNFYFVPKDGKGRSTMVAILNERQEAYITEMPGPAAAPSHSGALSFLSSLPPIDVPGVIEIARTNGLKAFADRTGNGCYVSLMLMSEANEPFWLLQGIDISNPSSQEMFGLSIDARTGDLVPDRPHTRRPDLK